MSIHNRHRHGFTLIEILAVVVILGILAAAIVPRVLASSQTAKINACRQNKAAIHEAVEIWYFNTGTWPDHYLGDIGADSDYFPDGVPVCPVDQEGYHLNHSTHRVDRDAH